MAVEAQVVTREDGAAREMARVLAQEERILESILDGVRRQRAAVVRLDTADITRCAAENEARCEEMRYAVQQRLGVLAPYLPGGKLAQAEDLQQAFALLLARLGPARAPVLAEARERVRAFGDRVARENDQLSRLTRHALACLDGAMRAMGLVPGRDTTYASDGRVQRSPPASGMLRRI